MQNTKIEWSDTVWNPTRGCSRVSKGCERCYAERQAARFAGDSYAQNPFVPKKPGPFDGFVHIVNGHPAWTGKVELIESKLTEPLRWKKPNRIFVNSMSDLFHEALPDEAIDRVFAVMALCPQHQFQVLTKRPERMLKWAARESQPCGINDAIRTMMRSSQIAPRHEDKDFPWTAFPLPNVWLGVSVEDQKTADERIPLLLQTPAAVRFVSYEPALGPVDFRRLTIAGEHYTTFDNALTGFVANMGGGHHGQRLDWIIAGYESGPGARPADIEWIRSAKNQCVAADVAFFFKQSAINGRKISTPILDGQSWQQFPEAR